MSRGSAKLAVLGIIPARGGSKGVLRKNVRQLAGKPLIAYSIEAAKQAKSITEFVVSTDDKEIATVAEQFGSPVLMRPAELAQDASPMVPVALHALERMALAGKHFDVVVLLQPTCPLRTAADIDKACELFADPETKAVVGVYQVGDAHPARMYRLSSKALEPLDAKWERANRQDLPPIFHRNGAIYAIRSQTLKAEKTFFPTGSRPLIMSIDQSLNIDEERDFKWAEFLFGAGKS